MGKLTKLAGRATGIIPGFATGGTSNAIASIPLTLAAAGGPVAAGAALLGEVVRTLSAAPSAAASATPGLFRQAVASSFIVYGKRRVGGLLIFFHPRTVGKEHWRYFVIAVAGHRCKGVTRWWLGDEQVTVDGAGKVTSGVYAGNAWLDFYRGTDDQAAHPAFVADTAGKWSASHRARGTALIYARFRMTDEVAQAGMPNVTLEVEGKDDILDPRTEQRGYTRNAALVFYDWMALPREEGGFGAYPDEIDWDWVAAQASVCDEPVPTPAGAEPRYAFDSYITTGAAPSEIRDTFVTCCAGAFSYSGGRMLLRPGYYVPPSATLSEDDVAGPLTVPALLEGDQTATEVTGTFIDPATLYQPRDVPTREVPADDVRQVSFDLPHVTSIYQGQRLLEVFLRRTLAERRATWPMNIAGLAVSVLDTVQLATARYGLSNYSFQVTGWGLSQDFSVTLQLEETGPEVYAFDPASYLEAGQSPRLAIAQPIAEGAAGVVQLAITSSFTQPLSPLAAPSDVASIVVANHVRRYADADVAVTGATIPGLAFSTGYFVAYDDPERAGGAVAYHVHADAVDAGPSPDHPGRHFVGQITTPAAGGTPSTGGGGGLPWWKVPPADPAPPPASD